MSEGAAPFNNRVSSHNTIQLAQDWDSQETNSAIADQFESDEDLQLNTLSS